MKTQIKQAIYAQLAEVEKERKNTVASLRDTVDLTDYIELVRHEACGDIWTDALQAALREHQRVVIPPSDAVYYIDATVIVPSDRHIKADGAVIRLSPGCEVLMLRNVHTMDGTHAPINTAERDRNISIHGGRWEESNTSRGGYGKSGRYTRRGEGEDEKRPFYGVSTCMLFNNLCGLSLTDMTFAHTAGFAVQTGDLSNAVFENITFESCYADGLHLNGRSENLLIRNICGEVGDDLVALNMYDWQNSSVNFGAVRNVLCDGLHLAASSPYKALRIEPGIYTYDDGSAVDCGLFNAIIKNVTGIDTFKMYFQTPPYKIGTSPEKGGTGSADNLFFENIQIDLRGPIDQFDEYLTSDPLRGTFAAFELGSNIGYVSFENIDLTLHREAFPLSCLACVGPKSIRVGDTEIFDPYLSSRVEIMELRNIRVNGVSLCAPTSAILREEAVRVLSFEDVNSDGHSTASGTIGTLLWDELPR